MSTDQQWQTYTREKPTPSSYLSYVKSRERWLLLAIAIALAIGVGMDISNHIIYEEYKGVAYAISGLAIIATLMPSVIRCAGGGYKNVWLTAGAALILLAIFLATFYTSYFLIIGVAPVPAGGDSGISRVLTFPPMISAACIACLGWYIHFQASAKNHRTSNSFHLIMQTRTSKEFLDRASRVHSAYPHGTAVPPEHVASIAPSAKSKAEIALSKLEEGALPEIRAAAEERLKVALDADAVKYMLNFYEFMAVGIKQKDLEEIIIYDTLGVTVTSIYARATPFVDYLTSQSGGQTLAFCQLDKLAKRWNVWLEDEKSEVNKKRAAGGAK
jgi:Domain of unknown function (DUF4760)